MKTRATMDTSFINMFIEDVGVSFIYKPVHTIDNNE